MSSPNYQDPRCSECRTSNGLTDCHYIKSCAHSVCKDCAKGCPICGLQVCAECETHTFSHGICDDCYEALPEEIVLTPADVLAIKNLFCS